MTGCYPVFVQPPPLNSSKFTESHAQQYKKSHISHEDDKENTKMQKSLTHGLKKKETISQQSFYYYYIKNIDTDMLTVKKQGEKKLN